MDSSRSNLTKNGGAWHGAEPGKRSTKPSDQEGPRGLACFAGGPPSSRGPTLVRDGGAALTVQALGSPCPLSGLDLVNQIDHLDRGHRGLEALVTRLGARALDRLLDRIGRQHTKDDRQAEV